MLHRELILVLFVLFLVILITSGLLKKKFGISEESGFPTANRLHKWIDIIMFVILLILVIFIISNLVVKLITFLTFLFIVQGLRAFMLWHYKREEKQWIFYFNSSVNVLLFLIFSVNVYF